MSERGARIGLLFSVVFIAALEVMVVLSSCASPSAGDHAPEVEKPIIMPVDAALDAIAAQLGTIKVDGVGALLLVNGFKCASMVWQDDDETVVVWTESCDFEGDRIVVTFYTDTKVAKEVSFFRLVRHAKEASPVLAPESVAGGGGKAVK